MIKIEKPVECDAVQEVFMAMVHVDKEGNLISSAFIFIV